MFFTFSAQLKYLPSTPNLTNPEGKVTLFQKNDTEIGKIIQKISEIEFFCIESKSKPNQAYFHQPAIKKAPVRSRYGKTLDALNYDGLGYFSTIHWFYRKAQLSGLYSRTKRDRILSFIKLLGKPTKRFGCDSVAERAIALLQSTQVGR